jgi:hypothetical protein
VLSALPLQRTAPVAGLLITDFSMEVHVCAKRAFTTIPNHIQSAVIVHHSALFAQALSYAQNVCKRTH